MRRTALALAFFLLAATPAASQEDRPAFADSLAVLRAAGVELGRDLGAVQSLGVLGCLPPACMEVESRGWIRLSVAFTTGISSGAREARCRDPMPVVRAGVRVTAAPPRFGPDGVTATVPVLVQDDWGSGYAYAYLLRREGTGWGVVGTRGAGRAFPLGPVAPGR